METGIKITSELSRDAAENIAFAFVSVIKAAKDANLEQKTIRGVIKAVKDSVKVENVTIQNCNIEGDKNIEVS